MSDGVRGPASYFPAIEAKFGRPIEEWKQMLRATGLTKPKELIGWLKSEHGLGHGYATALALHTLAEGEPVASSDELVDRLFTSAKAHWRPVYDELADAIRGFGDVQLLPKKSLVGFATKSQFAMLQPSTPERFDVGLKLRGFGPTERLAAAGSWNTMMTHRVQLTSAKDVDRQLLGWLRDAYDVSLPKAADVG